MTLDQLPGLVVLIALGAVLVSILYCIYQHLAMLYHRRRFLRGLKKRDYF